MRSIITMHGLISTRVIVPVCALLLCILPARAQSPMDQVREAIEAQLRKHVSTTVASRFLSLYDPSSITVFYQRRGYRPSWITDKRLTTQADSLYAAIREADREGLCSADYNADLLKTAIEDMRSTGSMEISLVSARTDLVLTEAFLRYASDLHSGRLNPHTVYNDWSVTPRRKDLAQVLQQGLDSIGIRNAFRSLQPRHEQYARLKNALAQYKSFDARMSVLMISGGPVLAKGDSCERVEEVKQRLMIWDKSYRTNGSNIYVFDDSLEQALRRFQGQHGIESNGRIDKQTLAVLNTTPGERVRQIEANLERMRWLPDDLGARYVLVNIPNFELDVVENGMTTMTTRVVVGNGTHQTPVFSETMSHIVLNPHWNVPPSIAVNEILSIVKKNTNYLKNENIRVLKVSNETVTEESPDSIDWSGMTPETFNYRLRMDPGAKNALGRIKFVFPNHNNVYVHDTPSKHLFDKTARHFSHGCIRTEKPFELAAHLLWQRPGWTVERIQAEVEKGVEQAIMLTDRVPVHLVYWTVWVDESGTVQFRDDIYRRDGMILRALQQANSSGGGSRQDRLPHQSIARTKSLEKSKRPVVTAHTTVSLGESGSISTPTRYAWE